jgi:hypothetical protein
MTDDDYRAELAGAQRIYRGLCEGLALAPADSPIGTAFAKLLGELQYRIETLVGIVDSQTEA